MRMGKENIPTKQIVVGKGDEKKTVEIYEWLTQEESDELATALTKDTKLNPASMVDAQGNPQINIEVTMKELLEADQMVYRMYLASPSFDEVGSWHPKLRKELFEKIKEHNANIEKK